MNNRDARKRLWRRVALWFVTAGLAMAGTVGDAGEFRWSHEEGKSLSLYQGTTEIVGLHFAPDGGCPYIHPLATGAGTPLTAFAPKDHPWHCGVWFNWKEINGVNYWDWGEHRDRPTPDGAVISHVKSVRIHDDRAAVALDIEYRGDNQTVLRERRDITLYQPDANEVVRVDWVSVSCGD
jgi:hypothetical protein